jgi:hypothetical protein
MNAQFSLDLVETSSKVCQRIPLVLRFREINCLRIGIGINRAFLKANLKHQGSPAIGTPSHFSSFRFHGIAFWCHVALGFYGFVKNMRYVSEATGWCPPASLHMSKILARGRACSFPAK